MQTATLRVFVTNGTSNGPALHGTNNTWTETGLTWNNQPGATTGVLANVGSMAVDTWAEYNVTGHITGNGVYNFVFMPESTNGTTFTSREGTATNRPQLVLTFAP